ncbi:hypothetical protein JTB14_018026 [Gonioctena quinquepunctata]|nr:hypothetical protein JTB14_018026 [Gonioctena quinquepunctata]
MRKINLMMNSDMKSLGNGRPRIIRTGSRGRPRKQYSMKSQSNESEPLFPENLQSSNSEEVAGAAQTLNSLSLKSCRALNP